MAENSLEACVGIGAKGYCAQNRRGRDLWYQLNMSLESTSEYQRVAETERLQKMSRVHNMAAALRRWRFTERMSWGGSCLNPCRFEDR